MEQETGECDLWRLRKGITQMARHGLDALAVRIAGRMLVKIIDEPWLMMFLVA